MRWDKSWQQTGWHAFGCIFLKKMTGGTGPPGTPPAVGHAGEVGVGRGICENCCHPVGDDAGTSSVQMFSNAVVSFCRYCRLMSQNCFEIRFRSRSDKSSAVGAGQSLERCLSHLPLCLPVPAKPPGVANTLGRSFHKWRVLLSTLLVLVTGIQTSSLP